VTKGERDLRRMLEQYPGVTVEHIGRAGYTLVRPDGARFAVGSFKGGVHDRHKLMRFLDRKER
jgi:hypothetical protein